jgi:methionine synthase II (cobalamin-independent)
MTFSLKTKAAGACLLIFIVGFACGFVSKGILYSKSEYQFQHDFEKLEPLTKELGLSDVQKALLFNILADHKDAINSIMKQVDPKIKIQLHIMRENIRNILDDNQKKIYAGLLKEHEVKQFDEE